MRNLALLAALVLSVLPGCSPKRQRPQGPLSVFVSIPPQKYFVERIGGRHVSVSVMVGAGQSPATYEPTPRQIARLASARIFFRIGVPFERAFVRRIAATFDELTIVDTSRGVPLRRMQQPRDLPNAHEGNDVETGTDPHIWLNPRLVKIQADTICSALCDADPDHSAAYKHNRDAFKADLDALDREIAKALEPVKGKTLFVFHPAFGYFADAYGLRQKAIETGGKEPSARRIIELIDQAKREGVRVIFVQPQFSDRAARAIAESIDGAVVPMNPLAPDYMENMRRMAAAVSQALAPEN